MNNATLLLVGRTEADTAHMRSCLQSVQAYRIIGSCTDTAQAYSLTLMHHPDLIICDIIMDSPNGLALLNKIHRLPDRPLTLLTSFISSDVVLFIAQNCGADFFLPKPYTSQHLIGTLQMMLSGRLTVSSWKPHHSVSQQVHQLLVELGSVSALRGFHYLATALQLLYERPELLSSLTKALYVEVARIHGTSPAGVERAIRNAIQSACRHGSQPPMSNGAAIRSLLRKLKERT